jgi:predicted DNA-binding protein (UPF0251 family)
MLPNQALGGRCGVSEIISWIAAESDRQDRPAPFSLNRPAKHADETEPSTCKYSTLHSAQHSPQHPPPLPPQHLRLHQFPAPPPGAAERVRPEPNQLEPSVSAVANDLLWKETALEAEFYEQQRRRRVYRGRTAAMLQRYMRYALETGRIPSILGGEFFRSRVTSYAVTTFEDRAIFVHDMEKCLGRLDALSQQILARVVLQGHDRDEAARLFGCTRMTIHRNLTEALDRMADILLEVGLLEAIPVAAQLQENPSSEASAAPVEKPCQGGEATDFLLSDCEDGK